MLEHYQTEFDGFIKEGGCLLFTIFAWACKLTDRDINHTLILLLIDELHRRRRCSYNSKMPAIGDEDDPTKEGVFVYDHEAVFNNVFGYLNSPLRIKYTGRIYMPWEEARGKESFGERDGHFLILQGKTENGNGHFLNSFYDPIVPSPRVVDFKSLRYYKVVV